MTDSILAGIWRVYQDPINRIQINLGMSFPTGGTDNTFTLLQPNGTYATSRAFYSMQPGSGTFDLMPGIVYAGALERWSWGLSYRARLPLGVNPEGWMYGDLHEFSGWGGYSWTPSLTTTIRVSGSLQGPIIGADPLVVGKRRPPIQLSTVVSASNSLGVRRSAEGASGSTLFQRRLKREFPFIRISMVHCSRKTGKPRSSCAGRFEERGVEPSFGVTTTIIRVMGAARLDFHET